MRRSLRQLSHDPHGRKATVRGVPFPETIRNPANRIQARASLMLWFLAYEHAITASWVGLKPLGAT